MGSARRERALFRNPEKKGANKCHNLRMKIIHCLALLACATSLGCFSLREIPPYSGTDLADSERPPASVSRELTIFGTRSVDWIAAGQKWAADIEKLINELREDSHESAWRIGVLSTINKSNLPAASFDPLERVLIDACMQAGRERGLLLTEWSGTADQATSSEFDAILVQRLIGHIRSGKRFELAYELRLVPRAE